MNIVSIRQKVARAISKAPLSVDIYRENLVDDGCGGYFPNPEEPTTLVATVQCLLDNSKSSQSKYATKETGRMYLSQSASLLTIWQEGITFKQGDFFTINGVEYVVDNAVNILNLNIYWELNLTQRIQEGSLQCQ